MAQNAVVSIALWCVAVSLAWSVTWRLGAALVCLSIAFNLSEWIREARR